MKIPVLKIPTMTDEREREIIAVQEYRRHFGREPEDVGQAIVWKACCEILAKEGLRND